MKIQEATPTHPQKTTESSMHEYYMYIHTAIYITKMSINTVLAVDSSTSQNKTNKHTYTHTITV